MKSTFFSPFTPVVHCFMPFQTISKLIICFEVQSAHNPKVVSSNLARATNIQAVKAGSKRPLRVGVSLL
jgi:hypothetical protein